MVKAACVAVGGPSPRPMVSGQALSSPAYGLLPAWGCISTNLPGSFMARGVGSCATHLGL